MHIWPAIDLRGGKCVRLRQGDYQRETVFSEDPVRMARQWASLGAAGLHLVDLDGARDGRLVNQEAIRGIVGAVAIPCQVGGGIRDEAAIQFLAGLGVERLVIGTQALRDPEWFRRAARTYAGRLVLGIDARQGRVATEGWLEDSETLAVDLAVDFEEEPLAAIVYTDIARDGMLAGPNLQAMAEMCQATRLPVIASGGVTSVEDVRQLARIRLAGCIIGRALYEDRLSLPEAIEAAAT
jgi:phosphoribosylformimino-5-aminoimidazole carboxamide ribotide isomerase